MVKLLLTDSQFNIFNILTGELTDTKDLSQKNVIFCEEKISLMIERIICKEKGGSLNTRVYSFGNYLREKTTHTNMLSQEGSAMAVKSILLDCELLRFNKSRQNLAPSLYDLIMQLKSASVSPEDIANASNLSSGVLGEKLQDVATVYKAYEEFIKNGGYDDQSSVLNELPSLIENDSGLEDANVFIVGYQGITVQLRRCISALIKKAKNLTAILTGGENSFSFVNETADVMRSICSRLCVPLKEQTISSNYTYEGGLIKDYLFNPKAYAMDRFESGRVYQIKPSNGYIEAENVATLIRQMVKSGKYRYRDITVALPNVDGYKENIRTAFKLLDVPYFLDEKKVVTSHPLIKLTLSYIEVFRKNFDRRALKEFYSNVLFCDDKNLIDAMQNYVVKYNINYSAIKREFILPSRDIELEKLENFRQNILSYFTRFDVYSLFDKLNVQDKLVKYSAKLKSIGEEENSAVNDQMYGAVTNVLNEMKKILPQAFNDCKEFRQVFISGVSAIELSIIPQYFDAVFIGGYREASLSCAKNMFAIGLTADVPQLKDDGTLLSDKDIGQLENLKLLIEPKIKIVNHRTRESVMLALCAFSDNLFVSCPELSIDNTKTVQSDVLSYLEKMFYMREVKVTSQFLTPRQGLRQFAIQCGEFSSGLIADFSDASAFYKTDASGEWAKKVLDFANKEIKFTLTRNERVITGSVNSPTAIEEYCKCPYYAFLRRSLRINDRQDGSSNGANIGTFVHDALKQFVADIDAVDSVDGVEAVFNQIRDNLLTKPEYAPLIQTAMGQTVMDRLYVECQKFCRKTYKWFNNSSFKADKTDLEVRFGENGKYPAISLLKGKVDLRGTIDRIDTCGEYCRIIDYKTGGFKGDDKDLFAGASLQLYLYAGAVKDKKLAGAYYLPIKDSYKAYGSENAPLVAGKTLAEKEVVALQDNNFEENKASEFLPVTLTDKGEIKGGLSNESLSAYIKYALLVSEKAVENMEKGVIVPSSYNDKCAYCPFKGMCDNDKVIERKVRGVDSSIIVKSVGEE